MSVPLIARLNARIEAITLFQKSWFRYSLLAALLVLLLFGFVYKAAVPQAVWYRGWFRLFRFIHHAAVLVIAGLVLLTCFRARVRSGRMDGKSADRTPPKKSLSATRELGAGGRKWLLLILSVLVLVSVLGFYNYGRFHGANYTHWWELIHYQFGAKYFPELGYDNLYYAFLAADRETGNRLKNVKSIRDLASNEITPTARAEFRISAVPKLFTARRWGEFKRDFVFYRSREGRWSRLLVDHGYNPSPVWTVTGRFVTGVLAGLGFSPGSAAWVMSRLDILLLVLMFVLIWRAFGFEVMALAVAFWGANPLVMFDYTGGAFLRQDWLVALVSGIALLRLKRPFFGGVLVAYAAATRIFPGVFFLFPVFVLIRDWFRKKRADSAALRYVSGGALAGLLLFGLSLQFAGGLDSWKTFLGNAREHDRGVYTNHISYRNLFVWEYGRNARFFRKFGTHYHEKWRQHKEKRVKQLAPLYYGTIVLFAAAFFYALRRRSWQEGVWASGFLPFLFFYPANYYFLFLLPLLFLSLKHLWAGVGIFMLLLLGFAGKRFVIGYDVYHIYLSLLLFLGFAGVVWVFWKDGVESESKQNKIEEGL